MASLQSPFLFMSGGAHPTGQLFKSGKSRQSANQGFLKLFAHVFSSDNKPGSRSEIPAPKGSDQSTILPDATASFVWIPEDDSERYFPFPNQAVLSSDELPSDQTLKIQSGKKAAQPADNFIASGDAENLKIMQSPLIFTETDFLPNVLSDKTPAGPGKQPVHLNLLKGTGQLSDHPKARSKEFFAEGQEVIPEGSNPDLSNSIDHETHVDRTPREKNVTANYQQAGVPDREPGKSKFARVFVNSQANAPGKENLSSEERRGISGQTDGIPILNAQTKSEGPFIPQNNSFKVAAGQRVREQAQEQDKNSVLSGIKTTQGNVANAPVKTDKLHLSGAKISPIPGQKSTQEQIETPQKNTVRVHSVRIESAPFHIVHSEKESHETIQPHHLDSVRQTNHSHEAAHKGMEPAAIKGTDPVKQAVKNIKKEISTETGHTFKSANIAMETLQSVGNSITPESGKTVRPSLKNRPQFVQETGKPSAEPQQTQPAVSPRFVVPNHQVSSLRKEEGTETSQPVRDRSFDAHIVRNEAVQSERIEKQTPSFVAMQQNSPSVQRTISEQQAVAIDPEAAKAVQSMQVKRSGQTAAALREKETDKPDPLAPKTNETARPVRENASVTDIQKDQKQPVQHSVRQTQTSAQRDEPFVSTSFKNTSQDETEIRQQTPNKSKFENPEQQAREASAAKAQNTVTSDTEKSAALPESVPGASQSPAPSNQQVAGMSFKTELAASRPEAPIVEQIVPRIQEMLKDGETIIRMTLQPKELGEVRIEIISDKDVMRAQIMVESREAQAMLKEAMPELRAVLESQNILLPQIAVDVAREWVMTDGQRENAREARFNRGFRGKREKNESNEKSEPVRSVSRSFGNHTVEYVA